uniref:keratin-associated protein 15-1 n=1 Tax=Jaculus jaculus TaxID=51337 RepID=UPI00033324EE|nr:keratin-associated protein 15-1 [Jaculus jaculus]
MSYNCSSGNFSSQSFGGFLRYPVSTFNSSYPSNVFYSPKSFHLGSSFYNGQQETFGEPIDCQETGAGFSPYQSSCYRPKHFTFSRPCHANFTGSYGYGNSGFGSFGFGGSGIQSLGCGSNFYRPTYVPYRSCQSSWNQPGFGSRFFQSSF